METPEGTTPPAAASPGGEQGGGKAAGFTQGQAQLSECASQGGTALVTIQQEPDILDPNITSMTFAIWVLYTLNTPMVRATSVEGQLEPVLLKEVPTTENGGISKDGKTYTLNFKEGLKWSDGQPITGRDFRFSWQTIMNPDYGAGTQTGWEQIKDVKLSNNDLTVTVTLKDVFVPFLSSVIAGSPNSGAGILLPEHKFKGLKPDQYAKSDYGAQGKAGHVGSGPFKIQEWKKGQNLTMVRNDNFPGRKACLDRMIFNVVPDVDSQIAALQRGEADLTTNYYASDIPTLERLKDQGVQVLANPATLVERYVVNLKDPKDPNVNNDPAKARPHPVLGDKNVRLAIAMGINRPAIVEKLLFNKAEVAVTELDNTTWFNENLKPYPYDPEAAKRMLDEAGWTPGGDGIRQKNGVRLSFTHATTAGNAIRETIQRAAINDLRNIGIEMKIQNAEPAKFFASFSEGGVLSRRQFDIGGYTTGITLDPDGISPYYTTSGIPFKGKPAGSNYGGYSNPQADKLWADAARELDPAKRKAMYDQIQQLIYDDVPVIYIYDRLQIDAAGPTLQTPPADFTGYIWWAPEAFSMKQ
jgi:peptide/nickel transport system substrate-binding protein